MKSEKESLVRLIEAINLQKNREGILERLKENIKCKKCFVNLTEEEIQEAFKEANGREKKESTFEFRNHIFEIITPRYLSYKEREAFKEKATEDLGAALNLGKIKTIDSMLVIGESDDGYICCSIPENGMYKVKFLVKIKN